MQFVKHLDPSSFYGLLPDSTVYSVMISMVELPGQRKMQESSITRIITSKETINLHHLLEFVQKKSKLQIPEVRGQSWIIFASCQYLIAVFPHVLFVFCSMSWMLIGHTVDTKVCLSRASKSKVTQVFIPNFICKKEIKIIYSQVSPPYWPLLTTLLCSQMLTHDYLDAKVPGINAKLKPNASHV